MFALVRYSLDSAVSVVPVSHVRDFSPEDENDFNPDILYDVFWGGDQYTDGGYYEAQIIRLSRTEEGLKGSGRKRQRPIDSCASHSSSGGKAKKKKDKQALKAAKHQRQLDLLADIEEAENMVPQKLYTDVCNKLMEATKELERCRELNTRLQEAVHVKIVKADCLCRYSSAAQHQVQTVFTLNVDEAAGPSSDALQPIPGSQCQELELAEPVSMPLPSAEQQQQDLQDVDQVFGDAATYGMSSGPSSAIQPLSYNELQEALPSMQTPVMQERACMSSLACGQPDESEMVDIGNGIQIPKVKWERLYNQNVDSRFVKEAATVLWGTEVLRNRSVTGTLSNKAKKLGRTQAYPGLSPEKVDALRSFFILRLREGENPVTEEEAINRARSIRKYLSEKCNDLRKQ